MKRIWTSTSLAVAGSLAATAGAPVVYAEQPYVLNAKLAAKFGVKPDVAVDRLKTLKPATAYTQAQIIANLRQKVKYVFVIYQENRSYDSYFGTDPGAEAFSPIRPRALPAFFRISSIRTERHRRSTHSGSVPRSTRPIQMISTILIRG